MAPRTITGGWTYCLQIGRAVTEEIFFNCAKLGPRTYECRTQRRDPKTAVQYQIPVIFTTSHAVSKTQKILSGADYHGSSRQPSTRLSGLTPRQSSVLVRDAGSDGWHVDEARLVESVELFRLRYAKIEIPSTPKDQKIINQYQRSTF